MITLKHFGSVKKYFSHCALLATLTAFALLLNYRKVRTLTVWSYEPLTVTNDPTSRCFTDGDGDDVLLTLFTTIGSVGFRREAHRATIRNWSKLSPRIVPVLFVEDSVRDLKVPDSWASIAKSHGWRVLDYGRTGADGVPIIKDMYKDVAQLNIRSKFIGYANADILFDGGLYDTVERVCSETNTHPGPVMISGSRCNVDTRITGLIPNFSDPHIVRVLAEATGDPFWHYSGDYFLFRRSEAFYWDSVPDFIVGRIGFDTWFMAAVIEWGVPSYDATATINSVHQTGPDGNYASTNMSLDSQVYNHRLMPNFDFSHNPGSHNCARHYTTKCPLGVCANVRPYSTMWDSCVLRHSKKSLLFQILHLYLTVVFFYACGVLVWRNFPWIQNALRKSRKKSQPLTSNVELLVLLK